MLQGFLLKTKSILTFCSIVLIAANVYLLVSTKDIAKAYSSKQNEAHWFLYQLVKEFTELSALTPYAYLSASTKQQTQLQYELTWSRFDILLHSRESERFITERGYTIFFSEQFSNLQKLESDFAKLETKYDAEQLSVRLNSIYQAVIQFIANNYRLNSPKHLARVSEVNTIAIIQLLLLGTLLLCFGLVTYIFYQDAKYHRQLSRTDTLTGIPNRLAFIEAIKTLRKSKEFTLLILDLNGFKTINDNLGHKAGDETLIQISKRLLEAIQPYKATIYRMGGDEFSILMQGCSHQMINPLLSHIEHCFEQGIVLEDGRAISIGTSIGMSRYPIDSQSIEQLLSIADGNMYRMKFDQQPSPKMKDVG
ncbi:GGDEF domain-containing protein [Vibrio agarivorans]|uniref:GGDEF domain-containing protein n=1 Tax=Vibrio agarivorans TaxID=153622 RepID=UPI00222FEE33|nr:GGDEF domain-containing protein [Vibrio agarivorans]MDN3660904.1 GGDEF domain-containing protein [Vibrio agarivorans]